MDVRELLDEDSFDPKKLFDEKQYGTLIIDRNGFSAKQNDTADLIMTLLDREVDREEKDQVYSKLKEMQAASTLVEALRGAKKTEDRKRLLAACWETGLDFTPHFLFFLDFLFDPSYEVAVEALTVVETVEHPDPAELGQAIERLQSSGAGHQALKDVLLSYLRSI